MTPHRASKKGNEKTVYSNLQDKRQKRAPKIKLIDLIPTAYIKKVFNEGDTSNWS